MWVSILMMWSSKLTDNIQDINHLKSHTANPKDCKNLTFDALSFFLLMQLDVGWASIIERWCYRPCKECVISLRVFNMSFSCSRYRCRCAIWKWSPLRENRAIVRSVLLRAVIDKWSAPASLIYYILAVCLVKIRVRAFTVRARVHFTRITFTFIMLIDMFSSCHLRNRSIRFDENPSSDPMLLGLPKFILYACLISSCCSLCGA